MNDDEKKEADSINAVANAIANIVARETHTVAMTALDLVLFGVIDSLDTKNAIHTLRTISRRVDVELNSYTEHKELH